MVCVYRINNLYVPVIIPSYLRKTDVVMQRMLYVMLICL
jgi:hypothetical protein